MLNGHHTAGPSLENKMKKIVYVDYENMNNIKSLPKIDGKYFFFIGAKQTTIPKSLVFYL